jgi:hypothetical protein
MHPEPSVALNTLFKKAFRFVAALSVAVVILPCAIFRTAEAAQPPATSPAYNLTSFPAELARLKTELQSARNSAEGLRNYRESLPEAWAVDVGETHYAVSTALLASWLSKAERQSENRDQEADQAQGYLDALASEVSSLAARSSPRGDSARAKLNAILARPEFAQTFQQTWWDTLRDRIDEVISNALVRLLSRIGGQKSLGYALVWIGICAAAILVAYWIFRHWFRAARVAEMDLLATQVPVRFWHEWIFAAREAASRSDYRAAVHLAYWAGITRLQDIGALSPDRAKTPREYLGALNKSKVIEPESFDGHKRALVTLTSRLEKIWYGYRIATEEDFLDSLTQLETLGCHLP